MSRLDQRERQLCEAIAKRDAAMRRELAEHVAIPTGTGYAPGLEKYRALLIQTLTQLGATIEIVEGDPRPAWLDSSAPRDAVIGGAPIVIACNSHVATPKSHVATRRRAPRILIAGHLDTVHDPHGSFRKLTIEDETIARGPGAADMKGGVLIVLHALRALADAGIEVNWTVLLNCDEETGSFQSARILRETVKQHDVGICVEPALPAATGGTGGALAIERMGSGQFMIEVVGRSAHVGREFTKGISAVYKLAEVITALSKMARPDDGVIVNVGPLRGGSVTNAVPDYAACWGNVRYRDPEAGQRLAEAIDALASSPLPLGEWSGVRASGAVDARGSQESHARPHPGLLPEGEGVLPCVIVNRSWNRPAKPATDQVMALARSIRDISGDLGQSIEFTSTGGVCDGNILQDAGLPTIDTLGVRGGNLHRPDEFIELPSIVERCQLLAILLARLADGRVTIGSEAVDR